METVGASCSSCKIYNNLSFTSYSSLIRVHVFDRTYTLRFSFTSSY